MPINTTSLIIGTNLKFATVSTQAAPGDNLVSIYAKSDGKMYSRYGSSGEETIIGGNASLTIGTGLLSSSGSAYNSVSATTLSLTNTGVTAGTYSNATLVVDAQGRITSATASTSITGTSITGTSITGTSLSVSSADTQTEITIESTAAASRSTLKLLTNGNDWEIGARGSNLAPNNAFYIYDLTAGAYRAVIDSSGRMGIGTTSPENLLHVKSTTAWTQPIFESTLTTGGAAVLLKSDYTTWQLAARGSANDTAPGSFSIYDSTANAIRMFINTSGQTGVGRIPSVPLDVEGWGRFVTPGTIGATNYGSTGGLIIRASAGSNDINYLQFVNNAGTSQYYHLLVKSDSRMYTSGPLSVDVGEVSVSSGVGDNFVLRTKTNTPNPNWTIGYGNGSGGVDTTREYIFSNAGTISINSGNLSVTGSTTLGSYLGIGSSVGQTGGTRFTVHESSATSLSTATVPNQKIRWTWYNDADGAIVGGNRQYQLWVYPYSNQSGSLAIFDSVMAFSIPTYTETALNVSSVVSGTRYVITSLGNTSQSQWNAMAGTSGNTYVVNNWFNAVASGPTGTSGTVISFAYTKQALINAPTVLTDSLTVAKESTFSSNIRVAGVTVDMDAVSNANIVLGNVGDGSGWSAQGIGMTSGSVGHVATIGSANGTVYFGMQNGSDANSLTTYMQHTGSTRYTFFNAGNVGIGTISPSTTFHVVGNTTLNGDIIHSGTGKKFYADWSDAIQANRLTFQTSTTNGNTLMEVAPNGTATISLIALCGSSNQANTPVLHIRHDNSVAIINSTKRGTGSFAPLAFWTSDTERMRIDNNGNVGIGTTSPTSTFHSAGSFSANITNITTDTTLSSVHCVVYCSGTASYAVTLPTATTCSGRIYYIKKTSTSAYTLTINTTSSQTIDGGTSLAFTQQYASYTVISNGSNWLII